VGTPAARTGLYAFGRNGVNRWAVFLYTPKASPARSVPRSRPIVGCQIVQGDQSPDAARWSRGDAYERYLGRWSASVGALFVRWLAVGSGARWLDVGCGTGALTRVILDADPSGGFMVLGTDPSDGFIEAARSLVIDPRATFRVASAEHLPPDAGSFDFVVSGLVLNFLVDPLAGVQEMARLCESGGTIAAYVWDYVGEMWLLRHFWEAAFELLPEARQLHEVRRFAECAPAPLAHLFARAGLGSVEVQALDATAEFRDFEDYWAPFLAGQGAAPAFAASLPVQTQRDLALALRRRLPTAPDGSITLGLRAWAVRGVIAKSNNG
jgi:SAM-dependent methyltransferase